MSFTYDLTNFPVISTVRLLVFDTNAAQPIFQDAEIQAALNVESAQNVIIGLSGYTPVQPPPANIYSYRRAAALLLRALAANKARLATISGLLDVKLSADRAADALNKTAQQYIDDEASAGFFSVAEMVNNNFSMRERLWKMLYRLNT